MTRRSLASVLAVIGLALAVALPAFAADPTAAPGSEPAKGPKASKAPEVEVTLSGTLGSTTDADGKTSYTLVSGGKTYTLEAGPSWYHGDSHPLKPFVGTSVTIVGEGAAGATDLDVRSVNGTALRAPGKPPWAGGWKRIGAKHPGWSLAKADKFKARFGDCFPPGKCKAKTKTHAAEPNETPEAGPD